MRQGAVAVVPCIEQLCPRLRIEDFMGDTAAAEHRLEEWGNAMSGQGRPAYTSAPEEHVAALVDGGHTHDATSADFADKLEIWIDARSARATSANTVIRALCTQEAFIDGESRQLDVGFFRIFMLEDRSGRARVLEGLFPACAVVGEELLADVKALSEDAHAVRAGPRLLERHDVGKGAAGIEEG